MPTDNPNELKIIGAAYGLARVTGQVIALVNRTTTPQSLSVMASNSVFGDSWPGTAKSLTVVYQYGNGAPQVGAVTENQMLSITGRPGEALASEADTSSPLLTVWGASYGPADVTSAVQGMIVQGDQSLSVTPNNTTFGDSWSGTVKSFVIVASYLNQVPFVDIVVENTPYFLKYRPPLQIVSAFYGLLDVTAQLQSSVSRRALAIAATNAVFGEGWPGIQKSLDVVYQYGDRAPQLAVVEENATLAIDYDASVSAYTPPIDANALNVVKAAYGLTDVTPAVRALIANQKLNFTADNAALGDGWPGTLKSFAMTYGWGPSELTTLLVQENQPVTVTEPPTARAQSLASLEGLMANGDVLTVQTGVGLYWKVGPTGQILATAANLESCQQFTVGGVTAGQPGITLQSSDGTYVMLGSDGTLHTGGTAQQAAVVVPSLMSSGGITLSLVGGTGAPFIAVDQNGALIASSSYSADFASQFNLRMTATAAGFENHLRAYTGMSPAELGAEDFDPLLTQVVVDLTWGFFVAAGLGPLMSSSSGVPQSGVIALLRANTRASAALDTLVSAVKNNPEASLTAAFLAFEGVIWDERLMWPIFRFIANQIKWWMVAYVATTVLVKLAIVPELEVAQLTVSLAIWAYNTTNDILAYVNSGGRAPSLALSAAGSGTMTGAQGSEPAA